MSFTRRSRSGCPRLTSCREDRHIVRNARVQPTASSTAIQAQWYRPRGNWTAAELNQVVFSDEYRFNLSSDDNHVLVWRPLGERLNPALALQRHTTLTADAMVWGVTAYITRSPLVLIRGTMTAQWYVHDHCMSGVTTHAMAQMSHFSTRQCSASHGKDVARLSSHSYYPSLACSIPRFVSNRTYVESLGTVNWASHEFERTRCKVTANMELNVSRYHTELVCLNARSHSC
ncbi:transposable element Tcb1 transposase [Trichonephila clavipes]|nr:transposable element Tcb1 transposase [Trichonephila clavipes]